jgi:hypothetical protein
METEGTFGSVGNVVAAVTRILLEYCNVVLPRWSQLFRWVLIGRGDDSQKLLALARLFAQMMLSEN